MMSDETFLHRNMVEPRATLRCVMVARNGKVATTARSLTRPPYQAVVQHWTIPRGCHCKSWTSTKGIGAPQTRVKILSSAITQTLARAGGPEPPVSAVLATQGHVGKMRYFNNWYKEVADDGARATSGNAS